MEIPKEILEFEDGFAALALNTSKNRRMAQDALMELQGISREEAHRILMNFRTDEERDISLKYGYNITVGGVSMAGYSTGPMMIGGIKGQRIAAERGSYDFSTGLLTSETEDGARRYSSHIISYAEYDFGVAKMKVTNAGSPNPTIELFDSTGQPMSLDDLAAQDPVANN